MFDVYFGFDFEVFDPIMHIEGVGQKLRHQGKMPSTVESAKFDERLRKPESKEGRYSV